MENFKDWIQDKIDDIKDLFKKWWSKKFSLEDFLNSLEQHAKSIFFLWIFWLLVFFYVFFNAYSEFKRNYINEKIQIVNHTLLQKSKEKKEKDKELYQSVNEQVIENKWYNIWDMICYIDNFDKRKIDYVNRWYKLAQINFQEEDQTFDIVLQWLRNYNSLTDLLVLLKQYKTLIDLQWYDVVLTKEKVWLWEIDYYTVTLKWKILQ